MKKEILNTNFTTTIYKKVPNKTKLANLLVEILEIEKEAVYRRLRGEVYFTFAEVAILSDKLGLSLDELLGLQSERKKPFTLQINDYDHPTKEDYFMWENYIHVLQIFRNQPDFSIYETWTTIPVPLCYKFPALIKFYVFKWAYQTKNINQLKRFEEIIVDEKFIELGYENLTHYMGADDTQWILSEDLFSKMIKDLRFFSRIRMLTDENIRWIKEDLHHVLNYLEELTFHGEYKESGKRISVYLADIDINANYSLLEANDNYIGMLRTLPLTSVVTMDKTSYQYMKNWFVSTKRLSVLISVSGEKERTRFFKEQRELISQL